jgi:hypothetical protein
MFRTRVKNVLDTSGTRVLHEYDEDPCRVAKCSPDTRRKMFRTRIQQDQEICIIGFSPLATVLMETFTTCGRNVFRFVSETFITSAYPNKNNNKNNKQRRRTTTLMFLDPLRASLAGKYVSSTSRTSSRARAKRFRARVEKCSGHESDKVSDTSRTRSRIRVGQDFGH